MINVVILPPRRSSFSVASPSSSACAYTSHGTTSLFCHPRLMPQVVTYVRVPADISEPLEELQLEHNTQSLKGATTTSAVLPIQAWGQAILQRPYHL